MPTINQHYRQARKNKNALDELDVAKYPDWHVTFCFYAALHLTNAWLVRNKYPSPKTHVETEEILATSRFDPRVKARYKALERYSRLARYECLEDEEALELVMKASSCLQDIENFVLPWIKDEIA